MMMETLMSGTQGEKAHIVYKEEDSSHMEGPMIIIFICLFRLCCYLQLFI